MPDGRAFSEENLQGAAMRMFRRASGYSAEAVRRQPVVGICSSWSEMTPCNLALRSLSQAVARGVVSAGGQAIEFPTISPSESLARDSTMFLRNLMAMDVEEMITSSPVDAVVLLGGCDKTVPAQLMGAVSAGKPAIGLVTGPRTVTNWRNRTLTIDDLWSLHDQRRSGDLGQAEWEELEGLIVGGIGTCNVLGTAATMAMVEEILGMSLPGTALLPATGAARLEAAEETGIRSVALAREGTVPGQLMTRSALENALRLVFAVGGSTNALIHIQALAGRTATPLSLAQVREISEATPQLTNVRPSGERHLDELRAIGGVPAVVGCLAPLLDLDCLAGTGRPWSEEAVTDSAASPALWTLDDPVAPVGGIAILSGSLAPDGAVLKRSAADPALEQHSGPAVVFDGVDDLNARIDDAELRVTPKSVLVLRNAGPVGAPGMPEAGAIPIPSKLLKTGVRDMVRISDARMSGTAAGTVVLHACPEAAAGGPLGLVRDGDTISLDTCSGSLDLDVGQAELDRRRADWLPPPAPERGYARLFHEHVMQAWEGCDFDFLTAGGASTLGPDEALSAERALA